MSSLFAALVAFSLWVSLSATAFGATLWKGACEKDLTQAIKGYITSVDIEFTETGRFDARFPRLLAAKFAPCVDDVMEKAHDVKWSGDPNNRAPFLAELNRTGDLLKHDLAGVYAMAQEYRDQTSDLDALLYRLFLHWAVEQDFAPAIYDNIQAQFANNPDSYIIGELRLLAGQGYVPAMVDAARRFLTGDGVEKNLGDAYYWIKRAEVAHADLSSILEEPYERLLEQMSANDRKKLLWASNQFGALEVHEPTASFHVLRSIGYSRESCRDRLPVALQRILRMSNGPWVLDEEPDVRLPRGLAVEFGLCIDDLIAAVEGMDWSGTEANHRAFIAELRWVRMLLASGLQNVYRQAAFYQNLNRDEHDKVLAFMLHYWATMHAYPPAEFDEVQENFAKSITPRTGGRLKRLADGGFVPAMIDAARRFLTGDGVEKNLGEAYYWIKRAEAAHGDLSNIAERPYERLLNQMNDTERERLEFSIVFYGPFI